VAEAREERLARNEVVFRTINENIVGIATSVGGEAYEFICECATVDCFERVPLTLMQYAAVRAEGAHFILVAGHEDIEIEQVIRTGSGYVVVQKDGVAGLVAHAEDPRN
jgi:hypothetical protein